MPPLDLGARVLLGDGPKGTVLQAAGLPLGAAPEIWNLERPDAVRGAHAAHASAGAAWVVANTFGANCGRLAAVGRPEQVGEVIHAAVRCAREGAPGLPLFGSLGPTGLRSHGWPSAYREAAEALAQARVDGFLVETIVALDEGAAAVRAAAALRSGPVWASYTPGEDGGLLDGTTPELFAAAMAAAGARVVGVNCGSGPQSLRLPAARLVRAGAAPVYAAPSAGLPRVERGRAVYPIDAEAFGRSAVELAELGVRLLAGCCGARPEHLQSAARLLKKGGWVP